MRSLHVSRRVPLLLSVYCTWKFLGFLRFSTCKKLGQRWKIFSGYVSILSRYFLSPTCIHARINKLGAGGLNEYAYIYTYATSPLQRTLDEPSNERHVRVTRKLRRATSLHPSSSFSKSRIHTRRARP